MTNRLKIAKASFILIVASIAGHSLSFLKEMLMANYFGITKAVDALYAALTVPEYIYNIILSAFTVIFIPLYVKYRSQSGEEANKIANIVISYLLVILFAIAAAIFIFAPVIINLGFKGLDAETSILAVNILRLLSVAIVFTGIVKALTGILNSLEHFSTPALSQMFITASTILLIIYFSKAWGIYVIVFGSLIGLALQILLLGFISTKKGFKYSFDLSSNRPEIKEVLSYVAVFFFIFIFSQGTSLVNRVVASYLPSGNIAALAYAQKLIQVPLVIFAGSVNIAVFPFFALHIAKKEIDHLKDTFSLSIRMSGYIFIPLTVIIILFSRPMVSIIYERGAFSHAAMELTSVIFAYFSLQLLFYCISSIMLRMLFAMQDYKSVLKVVVLNTSLLVLFNLILIRIVDPPAAGIALGTSLSMLTASIFYFIILKKRLSFIHGYSILKSLLVIALLSVVSGFFMHKLYYFLEGYSSYSLAHSIFNLAAALCLGAAIYFLLSYIFKVEEFFKAYNLVKHKISQRMA